MPYLDEPLYIHIELEEEKKVLTKSDLIGQIKSLKKPVETTEDKPFIISTLGKKEKKKKKRKKTVADEVEFIRGDNVGTVNEVIGIEENAIQEGETMNLLDVDSILNYGQEYDLEQNIVDKTIGTYGKRKKDKNNFRKEFNDELTLYTNMLSEVSSFGKDVEKQWRATTGSRARGASKYANELANLVLSAKSQKVSIVKELVSLKKTIADLTMKEAARKEKAGENVENKDAIATKYFRDIVQYGRKNFVDHLMDNGQDDDSIDDVVQQIENGKLEYSDIDIENYQDEIERRANEENPFRTRAGSAYIEFENRDIHICVKKCLDDGRWEFVAIDRDGQQVDGYPLPSRKDVGKMSFSDDDSYVKDSLGRSYKVVTYYLPDGDDYDND